MTTTSDPPGAAPPHESPVGEERYLRVRVIEALTDEHGGYAVRITGRRAIGIVHFVAVDEAEFVSRP